MGRFKEMFNFGPDRPGEPLRAPPADHGKAGLKPALCGQAWDASIYNRVALYRDFAPTDGTEHLDPNDAERLRFAEVLKVGGKTRDDATPCVTAFVVEEVSTLVRSIKSFR